MNRKLIIYAALTFIALAGSSLISPRAQACGQAISPRSRITIASGVRLRSAPAVTAPEVARLQVGVIVQELERGAGREKIAGVEDYWYRVGSPDGKEGWVFGSFTSPFDDARRAEIYKQIAADRLKVENASFADLTDLTRFLSAAAGEVTRRDIVAELELARLLAMQRALALIPGDRQQEPQFQNWLNSQKPQIAYSEPAGQWLLKSEAFWELQKKYNSLPTAERAAWEAANNPVPGECEGYPPCLVGLLNQTTGKYLELYPRGAHADEALSLMTSALDGNHELTDAAGPPDKEERTEALKELALLRAIVTRTSSPRKAKVLDLIALYFKHYR